MVTEVSDVLFASLQAVSQEFSAGCTGSNLLSWTLLDFRFKKKVGFTIMSCLRNVITLNS